MACKNESKRLKMIAHQKLVTWNPSMRLDHLNGKRSEIEAINGMVPVLGQELGIETPYNNAMVAVVRAREAKFQK